MFQKLLVNTRLENILYNGRQIPYKNQKDVSQRGKAESKFFIGFPEIVDWNMISHSPQNNVIFTNWQKNTNFPQIKQTHHLLSSYCT